MGLRNASPIGSQSQVIWGPSIGQQPMECQSFVQTPSRQIQWFGFIVVAGWTERAGKVSAGFPVSGEDHSQPLDMCWSWKPHLQVAAFKICLQILFRESGRWAFLPAPSAPIPEGTAMVSAHVLVCYILEGLMGTTLISFQSMVFGGPSLMWDLKGW